MNSDSHTANDVSPSTSLNISAIGEPEESLGSAQAQQQQDDDQEQVEDMDQESLVPHLVLDVSQPTQQEVD